MTRLTLELNDKTIRLIKSFGKVKDQTDPELGSQRIAMGYMILEEVEKVLNAA